MADVTLLLDTHTVLWWWLEPQRLSPRALALITDPENRCLVSAASAWETATKVRIGKFPGGERTVEEWEDRLATDNFTELPVSTRHAIKAGSLPGPHRGPFDRMIAAQSILEGLPVVSSDAALSALGAERVWE